MTPTEMNEQVALRIGYRYKEAHTAIISARCGSPFNVLQSQVPEFWMTPGNVEVNKLPPWSTDDGLAFKELWPRIIEVDPEAAIEIYQHIKKPCVSLRINDPSEWKMIWGNTWAEAICLAFIALMPLEEPK